jgi:alpha-galactosidase
MSSKIKIAIIVLALFFVSIFNGCLEMKEEERISKVVVKELKDGLVISNPSLVLRYRFELGSFELKMRNVSRVIKDALSSVTANNKRIYSRDYQERRWKEKTIEDEIGRGQEVELIFASPKLPTLIVKIKVYEDKDFVILKVGLRNNLSENLLVTEFRPIEINPDMNGKIELGSPPSDWRILLNGYGSWDYSGIRSISKDSSGKSWWIQSIVDPNTYISFTSGSLTALTWKTSLNHKMKKEAYHWWAQCGGEGEKINLPPNQSLYSEDVYVCLSNNPFESLEEWGRVVGKINHVIPYEAPPRGWCSWCCYFDRVSAEDVLKNARFIKEDLNGLGYEYIQIDDGWQKAWGCWESNSKFPSGMKGIAKELHSLGFKAGLWLAPFLVNEKLPLVKEHPDWFLRDEKSNYIKYMADAGSFPNIAGSPHLCLDATHPEVQEWLSNLFAQIKDWGYDYLKLDFLFAGAYEGMHWNKSVTGIKALREGLEIIRKNVGDDTYILTCGAPLLPMVGIVNGYRIGPDISYGILGVDILIWPFIKWEARNVATRYFMNGQLFNNDPDVTLVRSPSLTLEEAKTLVNLDILCNGVLMLGDELFSLTSDRVDLLTNKEILNLTNLGQTAKPLDLFEHPDESLRINLLGSSVGLTRQLAEIWDLEIDENTHIIGIFNWGDKAKQINLDFAKIGLTSQEYKLWDLWGGKEIGNYFDSYAVLLNAHSSQLIKISLS